MSVLGGTTGKDRFMRDCLKDGCYEGVYEIRPS